MKESEFHKILKKRLTQANAFAPTGELVRELKERESVTTRVIEPCASKTLMVQGPATVLVVKD